MTEEQKPTFSRDETELEEKYEVIALSAALSEEGSKILVDTTAGYMPDSHDYGEEGGGANISKMVGTQDLSSLPTRDKGTEVYMCSKPPRMVHVAIVTDL